MITLAEFIKAERLTMTATRTDANPNMEGSEDMRHWSCKIRKGRRSMTLVFSQGSAHKAPPTLADVLSCLASDAASTYNASSFDDWASELGYDADSRNAERIFASVMAQNEKLLHLLGADTCKVLMFDTEQL